MFAKANNEKKFLIIDGIAIKYYFWTFIRKLINTSGSFPVITVLYKNSRTVTK